MTEQVMIYVSLKPLLCSGAPNNIGDNYVTLWNVVERNTHSSAERVERSSDRKRDRAIQGCDTCNDRYLSADRPIAWVIRN